MTEPTFSISGASTAVEGLADLHLVNGQVAGPAGFSGQRSLHPVGVAGFELPVDLVRLPQNNFRVADLVTRKLTDVEKYGLGHVLREDPELVVALDHGFKAAPSKETTDGEEKLFALLD